MVKTARRYRKDSDWSNDEKQAICSQVNMVGTTLEAEAKRLDISPNALRRWLHQFGIVSVVPQPQKLYHRLTANQKRMICAQAQMPTTTVQRTATAHGLDANLLHEWLRDPRYNVAIPLVRPITVEFKLDGKTLTSEQLAALLRS